MTTPAEIIRSQEAQWAARKFWRDTYVEGTRITFDGQSFHFWQCLWTPRRRTETFGEYNQFPVQPIQPAQCIIDSIQPHAKELSQFITHPVPENLTDRFCHLLNKDYEFYDLQHECARFGICVYGLPMDGGIFPMVVKGKAKASEYKPSAKPQILIDYLEKYRNGKTRDRRYFARDNRVANDHCAEMRETSTSGGCASGNGALAVATRHQDADRTDCVQAQLTTNGA